MSSGIRELEMSDATSVAEHLDRTVSLLRRAIHAALLTGVLVVLLCVISLVVAATYGMLHNGDDFDFFTGGSGGGGGGDVIFLRGLLR